MTPRPVNQPSFPDDFQGMPPTETFVRDNPADPAFTVLKEAGANPSTRRGFRLVGADGSLEVPLAAIGYIVWPFQVDGKREWRMEGQPVPNVSGAGSNSEQALLGAPPVLRRTPVREL